MSKVTIEYFGMSGEGRTVTEAKRDAGSKIESALKGHYTPTIISWRGWSMLIYREPSGWHYRGIVSPEHGVTEGKVWGNGAYDAEEDALRAARHHMAQNGMDWTTDTPEDCPAFLTKREERSEWISYLATGKRFGVARDLGYSRDQ